MVTAPAFASRLAQRPAVSVCLATCNGERHLQAQLTSVLAQLDEGDEVVVADDHSSDTTLAILQGLGDARVRVLPQAGAVGERLGVVGNFERALAAARHDVIFLCDQDDVWLDGKVAQCVQALQQHLLVVTDCKLVDGDLRPLADSFFARLGSGPGVLKNLWRNSYLGCCMAFRRELLRWALPFPPGLPMHDMWLGLVAQCKGSVHFLPRPLVLYRRHGAAASTAGGPSTRSWGARIALRVRLARALARRVWGSPGAMA